MAPVETDLIITKCAVADFSSSMIECPRLFVFVDIILSDVKRKRLPSAGPSDNGYFRGAGWTQGPPGKLMANSNEVNSCKSQMLQIKIVRTHLLFGG